MVLGPDENTNSSSDKQIENEEIHSDTCGTERSRREIEIDSKCMYMVQ